MIFARFFKGTVLFIHSLLTRVMTIISIDSMKEEKYSILYVTGDGDKDEVRNFTARRNASIFSIRDARKNDISSANSLHFYIRKTIINQHSM